jgi:hypothetical protein
MLVYRPDGILRSVTNSGDATGITRMNCVIQLNSGAATGITRASYVIQWTAADSD